MGRYHPPASLDAALSTTGKKEGGFNSQGHPLGKRANKISSGILTIRFEMPFAIWCTTCQPEQIIGQGVRFNAEKKKVGTYYSSPIYSFRMRHGPCGGILEIRTDPKNTAYVVHEGGRKKEEAAEERVGAFGEILTEEERERRRNDAFAQLEGTNKDKETARKDSERLEELMALQERDWKDPAGANAKLRKTFRIERKRLEANDRNREEVADRLGLNIHVLDESAEDQERAKLVDFGAGAGRETDIMKTVSRRALFGDTEKQSATSPESAGTMVKTKAQLRTESTRASLREQLRGNTRAAIDPFNWTNGKSDKRSSSVPFIATLKRKRSEREDDEPHVTESPNAMNATDDAACQPSGLVDYDSED